MKSRTRKPIEIKIQKDGRKWEVVTAFLGNTVGDYLGKCRGLTEQEARTLADKWRQMQGAEVDEMTDLQREKSKPTKGLRAWDSEDQPILATEVP